ncbi:AI-2E family transporter [Chryseobacterium sp. POL2]|uniref:AI-2E family transporter n=1 Tax=Chryseobacterium sp. POL2 TaxID=2713414 RepID=UPI0013E1F6D2|nr:AI-2E family transporter [Chryseobacterium sp. POL2]QIG90050.1 AI-2E family transporter [Chryseobacterium sp. POL2]
MPNPEKQINDNIIKQIALILLIVILTGLICYNLAMFIPSLLGALTLYIISRRYLLYLLEDRGWKPALAASVIIVATLVILILPVYWIVDLLIEKLGNAQAYMVKFNAFIDKVHDYIFSQLQVDILSKENLDKLKSAAGRFSTSALSTTFNTFTVIFSMYFILYFMLIAPRKFEKLLTNAAPFKKSNINLLGEKIRKMVIANAVGIPVVALGQAVVAIIGYFIFGAPSPILLFALTFVTSMIPIVGAAIIYVPVSIFMIAEGQTGAGLGLAVYCLVIVGLTDNLLRFTLLKKLENIHPLNTVFGIIAGMNIFGFLGLIFGPILVSVTALLIQVYRDEFSGDDDTPKDILMPDKDELDDKIDLII